MNHFPKTSGLGKKDHLCRYLKKMKIYGKIYNFSPLTFILPSDYSKYIDAFMDEENKNCLWICKPSCSSRGRRIFLIKDMTELKYSSQCVV